MYKFSLSKKALKRLKKLDRHSREEILKIFSHILENPHGGKSLRYELKGVLSIRSGKKRVLYQIIEESKTVYILAIEHRKKAYRG